MYVINKTGTAGSLTQLLFPIFQCHIYLVVSPAKLSAHWHCIRVRNVGAVFYSCYLFFLFLGQFTHTKKKVLGSSEKVRINGTLIGTCFQHLLVCIIDCMSAISKFLAGTSLELPLLLVSNNAKSVKGALWCLQWTLCSARVESLRK